MEYREAKACYACKRPFSKKNGGKVIDHDHLNGDIRGIACNACNLRMKVPKFIPVVFHNLKGFDAHLIMNAIGEYKDRSIRVIPNNKKNYISFTFGDLRFIDSLQFLNESLATLAKNLAQEGRKHFKYLRQSYPNDDHFDLLMRKCVFPYDYVDSEEKLKETHLPSKESFFSQLTGQHISDDDYQFALKVWKELEVNSIGEYSDIYLKIDIVLLADVFERFRDICLQDYGLDPCYFYTSPGLSWSAMLKKTGIVLDLITDIDKYLFFEKAIRGGISSIFHRYAKANNRYMGEGEYNPHQESSYLLYLDANNLYGWAMSQHLPYGFFEWVEDEQEVERVMSNLDSLCAHSEVGYAFEVDLQYGEHLHHEHSDFPLAAERMKILTSDLSPYCKSMLEEVMKLKALPTNEKLIPNLYDKDKYVLHYRNLQLYLQLGLKVKHVHRVIKFRQSAWLKTYIDFNTEKRKQATTDFAKNLYKLLNNSIFGRSLMNTRKHVDVKLCHTEQKLHKYTSRPSFKSLTIFNEDLVAVENRRVDILLNQPIYVGFSISDLSKHLTYDFHYNHMKKLYDNKIKLCFSDTDSFLYHIFTDDVYSDMKQNEHLFDTSDYPSTHFLHSTKKQEGFGQVER